MGKIIPLETKKLVQKMFRQGSRSRKVSDALNLDRSTVKEWQYLYDGGDTRWVTDQPIERVYRFPEIQRAFIVRAYLTKALTMADLCRPSHTKGRVIVYSLELESPNGTA